jgi:hypothetical protein
VDDQECADRLRKQTACGQPKAGHTSGLVAHLDGEPAGWCAVEPRTVYKRLLRTRYPMITHAGEEVTWGELHVGSRSIFAAAGFAEVSRPTLRRVMLRIDF